MGGLSIGAGIGVPMWVRSQTRKRVIVASVRAVGTIELHIRNIELVGPAHFPINIAGIGELFGQFCCLLFISCLNDYGGAVMANAGELDYPLAVGTLLGLGASTLGPTCLEGTCQGLVELPHGVDIHGGAVVPRRLLGRFEATSHSP